MSSNICGNCENFKPGGDEKFFNCTSAEHAGVKYVMQVRADTQSCDAFKPFQTSGAPPPVPPEGQSPLTERAGPVGICPWVKIVLLVALVLLILLLSWLLYSCATGGTPEPSPTPPPVTSPSPPPVTSTGPPPVTSPGPTGVATPVPTPTPRFAFDLVAGEWAETSAQVITVRDPVRTIAIPAHKGSQSAPPGTVYIVARVTIGNTGSTGLIMARQQFGLQDSMGRGYKTSGADGSFAAGGTLPPGKTGGGKIYFNIPEIAHGLEIVYYLEGAGWGRWRLPF